MSNEAEEAELDQESTEQEDGFDEEANRVDGVEDVEDAPAAKKSEDEDSKDEIEEESKDEKKEEKSKEEKPAKSEDDKSKDGDGKNEDEKEGKEKTAIEKAEEAAKGLDEPEPEGGSVLDDLPEKYAWAKDVVGTEKFENWVKQQSKLVQRAATSSDVNDAMEVLDMYQASTNKSQPAEESKATEKQVESLVKKFGSRKFKAPDGTEMTVSELVEEYGNEQLMTAIASLADAIAEERFNNVPKPKEFDASSVTKLNEQIQAMAAEQRFWDEVLDAHPDAKKLVRSGAIEKWVEKKSDSIKRLFKTNQPEHAIIIIDAYKEDLASSASQEEKDKASERKKGKDSLYSEGLKSKKSVEAKGKGKGKSSDEEYDEGFDEEADK